MKKGDIFEGVITDFDFPNKGSLVLEDRKITIKDTLKGQRVKFMITKRKSGMAEGRMLEILEPSPLEDAVPKCPHFENCGGCAYLTMSYENQLAHKEEMVKKLLDKALGSDADYGWEGIIPSPITEEYRNKMEFTFGDEYKDGPLALGLHKKGSFHDILRVDECRIIDGDWRKILKYSLDFFAELKVPFYHRMRHEGILRNLVVRKSKATGEFLINLVAATQWNKYGFDDGQVSEALQSVANLSVNEDFSGKQIIMNYVAGLLKLEKETDFKGSISGILYTENDSLGDVVQSDRTILLYGQDYITEEVMGLKFKISPFSFFQTNTKGCEVLYEKARQYIMSSKTMENESENSGKLVLDLYSGTGTIAQMMSKVSGKVIGIEIVEEAVVAARENAKLNGLSNCEFIAGDVLKAIDLVEEKPDLIILDPPRDGINPKALEKILAFGVEEMVYISCKPTSLARDLGIITSRGYQVKKACAVDQFPGTRHVETVVLLSQQKPDDLIEVEIELDELDLTTADK